MESFRPSSNTILVLAPATRQVALAQQLEALGYRVVIGANDGGATPPPQQYDLVLMDSDTPGAFSRATVAEQLARGVPVLTLESRRGIEQWTEDTLHYRISAALQNRSVDDALAERARRWAGLNVLDPDTLLFSRRYFDAVFPIEIARAARIHQPLSLVFIGAGVAADAPDRWREWSGRLLLSLRQTDFVARFSEQEMLVMLPFTEAAMARAVAARLLKPLHRDGARALAGVAAFPQHATMPDAVIAAARQSLLESYADQS